MTPKNSPKTRPNVGLKITLNSTRNWVEMHKITHKEAFINYPCLSVIELLMMLRKTEGFPSSSKTSFLIKFPGTTSFLTSQHYPLSIEIFQPAKM